MKNIIFYLALILLVLGGCNKDKSNPVTDETKYSLTPTVSSNGTVSPSTAVNVASGGSQRFAFTPANNYQVDSVFVDGVEVDSLGGYTFANVTANHTVRVVFSAIQAENWSYTSSSSKFGVTLLSNTTTIQIGSRFDVLVVYYNLTNVFGTAIEINLPTDKISIRDVVAGPYISGSSALVLKKLEYANNRASFGATFTAGSGSNVTGSGVVFKLKCRSKVIGNAQFSVNTEKLNINQSDGLPIINFSTLQIENLTITIQ